MPIIIRLQNLPLSANSLDIRRFFHGLTIPDGGVHIVGGKNGDTFIAFSNDEDARQAMAREDGYIKDSRIKLFLSSKNEMQQIIEQARSQNAQKAQSAATISQNPVSTNLNELNTLATSQFTKNLTLNETLVNSQAYKLSQNYNSNSPSSILNLQEVPNYTRHRSRSPVDRARSRSNSPYSRLRINKLLDEVRKLDPNGLKNLSKPVDNSINNLPAIQNVNGSKSRLSGFIDIPTSNSQQSDTNTSKWNNSIMGGIMVPSFQNRILDTNNAYYDQTSLVNTLNVNNSGVNACGSSLINSGINQVSSSNINSFNFPINKYAVELRGLPFRILPIDIQDFFRNFGIIIEREQIKILINDQGYTTGGAILKLKSEREFEQALLTHGRFLGNNRIEITPMMIENNANLPNNLQQQNLELSANQNFNGIYPPVNNNMESIMPNRRFFNKNRKKETFPMFMKGIPYNSCNEEDIEKFFDPIPIYDINLIFERNGRPSGNAYVIFDSKQDFDLAMKRNKKYMGSRYIELFLVSEEEVEKHKNDFESRSNNNSRKFRKTKDHLKNSYSSNVNTSYCIQIKGLPPTVNNRDLTNYFMEFGVQASAIHIMLKADGMNAGEAFVEFWTRDFLNKALRRDGYKMGHYRLSIKEVSYNKVCEIVGLPLNSRAKLVKTLSSDHNLTSNHNYHDRRCTVIASNISNRANIGDICAFFQEFDLHRNQVDPKYNKNELMDEVFIKFRSPEEAERAIRLMNKKYMIGKQIHLRSAV